MAMTSTRRKELMDGYRINPKDTGSVEVQVALLTERITKMTEHLKSHSTLR